MEAAMLASEIYLTALESTPSRLFVLTFNVREIQIPKKLLTARALFTLNVCFCTCWYYPL